MSARESFSFRRRMENETLSYATERLRKIADKFAPESGDTARTPDAFVRTERATTDAGASSPGRTISDIRDAGSAWLNETELERLCDLAEMNLTALRQIDAAASVAHDFIYGKNGVTKEQASRAIWVIHDAINSYAESNQ